MLDLPYERSLEDMASSGQPSDRLEGVYELLQTPKEMEGKGTYQNYFVRGRDDGREYVLKPAMDEDKEFAAMGEAAAYALAERIGVEEVRLPRTTYGRFLVEGGEDGPFCVKGSLQEYVRNRGTFERPGARGYFDRKRSDFLAKNQVFDRLIGNYDTHNENFLVGEDGRYWAIDKGQAFRFYGRD